MARGSGLPSFVTLGSHLDVRNVAAVRTTLNAVQDASNGDVIVDMSLVQMIDAAGLGMLAAAHVRARRRGQQLVLRGCTKEVRRVLAVTRLNRILTVERSSLDLPA
jgi:anti-sigma B factor antagonist